MDFLNKAFAQLTDLFRSMTPGARITAGLLLIFVVVSLGYLFTHQISGPDMDLMNGVPVPADHLPAMEAAFDKAGLKSYQIRGTQILVPSQHKSAYMAALADARALPPNIDKVFEQAFQDTGILTSKDERDERLKIAKQTRLGLMISDFPGIDRAHVEYNVETLGGSLKRERVTTATVMVKPEGGAQLDEAQVSTIRYMVAHAIGAKPTNVTVVDSSGPTHHGDLESGNGSDNLYASLTRGYEQQWREKILNSLNRVPGVTVTASVILDRERINRTRSVKYDPKATTIREMTEETTRTQDGAGPAGQPGYQAQQPNTPTALTMAQSRGTHESQDESKREAINVANTEQKEMETIGLTPKQVKVSIGIPSSYFEKVWRERNPAQDGQTPPVPDPKALDTIRTEEMAKIRDYIAGMLPAENVTDPTTLVTIKEFPDIKLAEIPGPSAADQAINWFGSNWTTVGLLGLALTSLIVLRSMIRSAPVGPPPETAPVILSMRSEAPGESKPDKAAAMQSRLARFSRGGPTQRDELSELGKEDPDAAVNILRNWIGNAG